MKSDFYFGRYRELSILRILIFFAWFFVFIITLIFVFWRLKVFSTIIPEDNSAIVSYIEPFARSIVQQMAVMLPLILTGKAIGHRVARAPALIIISCVCVYHCIYLFLMFHVFVYESLVTADNFRDSLSANVEFASDVLDWLSPLALIPIAVLYPNVTESVALEDH